MNINIGNVVNNETRSDKFIPMSKEQFNLCVAFALRNSNKKISYCKIENKTFYGGMADTLEEALQWCKKFYEENPNCDLKIGDYSSGGVTLWDKYSILHEIGIISDEDYNKYLNNLELED